MAGGSKNRNRVAIGRAAQSFDQDYRCKRPAVKYIDTNVIIRLITNDVPELAQKAADMLEAVGSDEVVILDAVISEVCFVLEFNPVYKLPRSVIYDGLHAILDSMGATRGNCTDAALDLYIRFPKLDYVDCLLHAYGGGKKANVLTFDNDLNNNLQ